MASVPTAGAGFAARVAGCFCGREATVMLGSAGAVTDAADAGADVCVASPDAVGVAGGWFRGWAGGGGGRGRAGATGGGGGGGGGLRGRGRRGGGGRGPSRRGRGGRRHGRRGGGTADAEPGQRVLGLALGLPDLLAGL